MAKMSKKNVESLSKIIARLEDWQNRPTVQWAISNTSAQSEINAAKSKLLGVLRQIETN